MPYRTQAADVFGVNQQRTVQLHPIALLQDPSLRVGDTPAKDPQLRRQHPALRRHLYRQV